MDRDRFFMERAVELGSMGMNRVSPNPRVGCVIVKDGTVISEAFHRRYGGNHAEVEAIEAASGSVEGSTVYVTLEPCSHYGKTPPCTERLIGEKVKRVVIGLMDPNPQVKGAGILSEKGIDVKTGVLEDECRELVRNYIKYVERKLPYVTVKSALSWDGKIAAVSGDSRWISGRKTREYTMRLRGENDAILVGVNTVNADNPKLTYRLEDPEADQPLRVVLDGRLNIDRSAEIIGENTLIVTTENSDIKKKEYLRRKGAQIVELSYDRGRIKAHDILTELYRRDINSLLVEGGGDAAGAFFDEGMVDRVIYCYGPLIIGGKDSPAACGGAGAGSLKDAVRVKNIKRFCLDDDIIMQGDID